MKIFVTGATGFIGSHFVRLALAEGCEVVAHRRSDSSVPPIPFIRQPAWIATPLASLREQDLRGCDVLVHMAAAGVSPKPSSWDECFAFNCGATLTLAQAAIGAGIRAIVAAGTYAEYGRSGLRFERIPPDAPLEPTDAYAASKAACGIALTSYTRSNKARLYYGRIFSAFGEGQSPINFWPTLQEAGRSGEDFPMTRGEQIRDYIPVEDVATAFLSVCANADALVPGEPVVKNVASGNPVSLRQFAETWWKRWNAQGKLLFGALPYRQNEVMKYVPLVD